MRSDALTVAAAAPSVGLVAAHSRSAATRKDFITDRQLEVDAADAIVGREVGELAFLSSPPRGICLPVVAHVSCGSSRGGPG